MDAKNNYRPEGYIREKYCGYTIDTLKKAINSGDILEAPVLKCTKDLTLVVNLGNGVNGYIPLEEFENNRDGKPVKSIAVLSRVGRMAQFKVVSVDVNEYGEFEAQLSRKKAQVDTYNNFISKLVPGQVISALATYVETYGIFCDIGCGFMAMIPIEMFCTTRISDPKKALKGIRRLKAVVKSIDDTGKVTLSHKELLGTWKEEAAKFEAGEAVVGIVRSIEPYGIFVELTPNLIGLSELYNGAKVDDSVKVFIKVIDEQKMKVKLAIIGQADVEKESLKYSYHIPESGMIKDWIYSPDGCTKIIETHF